MADTQSLLLVKPQTFMNLSGQAVGAVMKKFNIPIARGKTGGLSRRS
jgi:peptidyl-tRNA hydrolase